MDIQTLENINYKIIPSDKVRDYVIDVCEKEWDPEDFPQYGDDLYNSNWKLKKIEVDKITPNIELLNTPVFKKDVELRVKKQKELNRLKTPIPPLILRAKDLFIFDGYARYLFFKEIGIKTCFAYLGH